MDPHKLLAVQENISAQDLDARYRNLAKMFHPDRHQQDATAKVVFQLLSEAYRLVRESKAPKLRDKAPLRQRSSPLPQRRSQPPQRNVEAPNTTLAEPLRDPYFHQEFSLCDYFDEIPRREKCLSKSKN